MMDTLPSLKDYTVLEDLFLTASAIYSFSSSGLPDEGSLADIPQPNIVSLTLAKTPSLWLSHQQRLRRGLVGLAGYKRRDSERFRKLKLVRCDTEEVCFDSSTKEALDSVRWALIWRMKSFRGET